MPKCQIKYNVDKDKGVKGKPQSRKVQNISSNYLSNSELESEDEVKAEEPPANYEGKFNHNLSSSSGSSDTSVSDSDMEGDDRVNKSQRGQMDSDLESDIIPVSPKVVYKKG